MYQSVNLYKIYKTSETMTTLLHYVCRIFCTSHHCTGSTTSQRCTTQWNFLEEQKNRNNATDLRRSQLFCVELSTKPFKAMWPSLEVDSHMMQMMIPTQEHPNVVKYVVKV